MSRFATRRSLLIWSVIAAIAPMPSVNGQTAAMEKAVVEQSSDLFL